MRDFAWQVGVVIGSPQVILDHVLVVFLKEPMMIESEVLFLVALMSIFNVIGVNENWPMIEIEEIL